MIVPIERDVLLRVGLNAEDVSFLPDPLFVSQTKSKKPSKEDLQILGWTCNVKLP